MPLQERLDQHEGAYVPAQQVLLSAQYSTCEHYTGPGVTPVLDYRYAPGADLAWIDTGIGNHPSPD